MPSQPASVPSSRQLYETNPPVIDSKLPFWIKSIALAAPTKAKLPARMDTPIRDCVLTVFRFIFSYGYFGTRIAPQAFKSFSRGRRIALNGPPHFSQAAAFRSPLRAVKVR